MALAVDHAVVNVVHEMDAAAARFAALGFTLTPRGRHSLGSINHLMVFERDYLELVGVPAGDGAARREIAESPRGLNGLVFATGDAAALHRSLVAHSIPAQAPLDFDRPVEIDGTLQRAAFRTVRLDPGYVHGGRVYFCEHATPGLVWRRPWQTHRNGVDALAGMTIAVPDPATEALRYGELAAAASTAAPSLAPSSGARPHAAAASRAGTCADGDDGAERRLVFGTFALRLMTPERYRSHYGSLGCDASGREAFMGALTLRTRSLDLVRACLDAATLARSTRATARGIVVAASAAFNAVIEFEA